MKPNISICIVLWSCTSKKTDYAISGENSKHELYNGPIIDMHIHAFDSTIENHMDQTFARFEEHNIVKAVVSPALRSNEGYPSEIWYNEKPNTVLIGDGLRLTPDKLRQKYEEGKLHLMAEFLPFYEGMLATDERLIPYFDLAEELDIPVGYHIYPGGATGHAYNVFPKIRAKLASPLQLEEVLIARPNLRIYIMHAGWPYLEDMKALMFVHPQVYVDLGVISWARPKNDFHNYLKGLVDAGFDKRIMFGSDQLRNADNIDIAINAINSADFLTHAQKADIFYNNASRFLKLPEEEIKRHQEKAAQNRR